MWRGENVPESIKLMNPWNQKVQAPRKIDKNKDKPRFFSYKYKNNKEKNIFKTRKGRHFSFKRFLNNKKKTENNEIIRLKTKARKLYAW